MSLRLLSLVLAVLFAQYTWGPLLVGAAKLCAEEPPTPAAIEQLVKDLDHDKFAVRERAYRKLLEIGLPALPDLTLAASSTSLEQRHRARLLVTGIQQRILRAAWVELARQDDEELDLEQGMWLISRMIDPAVRRDDVTRQLDELAERVRKRLGKDVSPRAADPQKVVEAIRQVLFVEQEFTGNAADYSNPKNSSLSHVLASRKGLPVVLSQIVVCVGRRLHVPLVGLGLPGRYMVKYDGEQGPEGFPKADIVLDPFGGGKIVTAEVLATIIPGFDPEEHLQAHGRRETLTRMLRNVATDFAAARQPAQADLASEFLELVESYEGIEDLFK